MKEVKDVVAMIGERLKKMAQSNAVVATPISFGDRRVLPLRELSLGNGGGAKARPVGVIVFTDEGVKVEKIPDRSGPLDKIFEKIPDLIDMAYKHGRGRG
jgi:uncharacterized spore protein YtfJ